jgi:hypothetical protein
LPLTTAPALATAPNSARTRPATTLIGRSPERVNLPLNEITVVFAIGVIAAQLQRRVVCLDRIGPLLYRLLGSGLFILLTRAIEGIAEVKVGILLI